MKNSLITDLHRLIIYVMCIYLYKNISKDGPRPSMSSFPPTGNEVHMTG